jgi:hypothetical protein
MTMSPLSLAQVIASRTSVTLTNGVVNMVPMDDLSAFGCQKSVPSPMAITPAAPAASAERTMVPRFPGLPTS